MNSTVNIGPGYNLNVVDEYDAMEAWGVTEEQMEDVKYQFYRTCSVDDGAVAFYPLGYLVDIVFDVSDDDKHDKNVELNAIHRNDYFIVEGY